MSDYVLYIDCKLHPNFMAISLSLTFEVDFSQKLKILQRSETLF